MLLHWIEPGAFISRVSANVVKAGQYLGREYALGRAVNLSACPGPIGRIDIFGLLQASIQVVSLLLFGFFPGHELLLLLHCSLPLPFFCESLALGLFFLNPLLIGFFLCYSLPVSFFSGQSLPVSLLCESLAIIFLLLCQASPLGFLLCESLALSFLCCLLLPLRYDLRFRDCLSCITNLTLSLRVIGPPEIPACIKENQHYEDRGAYGGCDFHCWGVSFI